MRLLLAMVSAVLPQTLKRLVYNRLFGWSVHPSARIGVCLILVDRLVVEKDVVVSHFNVIKGCELVRLEAGAGIGAFNWVSAAPRASSWFRHSPQRRPEFLMGQQSALTQRHVVDCSDTVEIGHFSVIGGMRSQVLTHAIDFDCAEQRTAPVHVGAHCLVSTGCILLAGSRVPDRSLVAAGAVITPGLEEQGVLYGGVPARALKVLDPDAAWFGRRCGQVL